MGDDPWKSQLEALGHLIRTQRELGRMSLRQMAERANISNAYLSQIERGLHQPSVRVLRSIASALNLSAETLLRQSSPAPSGHGPEGGDQPRSATMTTENAIRSDPALDGGQKEALLQVYRSFKSQP
ncbi:MAG: helix-turn-helix domain-containing protein [Acidimicrobiales bacterium]